MDCRFPHPFTACISGPSSCGKTFFLTRFINSITEMVHPIPEEIIYCYSEYQPLFDSLKERGVIFHEGIPDVDSWTPGKRRLVILDDLMSEADERVTRFFTKISHHRSIKHCTTSNFILRRYDVDYLIASLNYSTNVRRT